MKGLPRLVRFLPKVMLALLVSVSAEGYKKLAVWLNDMGMCRQGRPHRPGDPYRPREGAGWPLTHLLGS